MRAVMKVLTTGAGTWLILFLVVQRLAELDVARRNTRKLRTEGAVEFGASHYPVMVTLHTCWLLTLLVVGYDRPVDPLWLALFGLLQLGRGWAIASLGRRWTTRVLVSPGTTPVTHGPYRFINHPNYAVVTLEVAVVPLALGLPMVALIFTAANAPMLAWRIRVENRALAWASRAGMASPAIGAVTLANGQPRR
jgi:methyltransferase